MWNTASSSGYDAPVSGKVVRVELSDLAEPAEVAERVALARRAEDDFYAGLDLDTGEVS